MPISCFCSHCGARISAPDKAAGRKVKCPKCRAEFLVPVLQAENPPVEILPVIGDAPQARHWSAPPPVRLTKASEPQAYSPEHEPPAFRLAEDNEDEMPLSSRFPVGAVYIVWGLVALVAFTVAAIFLTLAAQPALSETDVGTEEEAIAAAKNYVCPVGMPTLGKKWNPAWRPADNCRAVLNGKDWTVRVPTRVVDWSRFKGDPDGFFTITIRKVRPGHGNMAWDEIGTMKYHGRSDSVEE